MKKKTAWNNQAVMNKSIVLFRKKKNWFSHKDSAELNENLNFLKLRLKSVPHLNAIIEFMLKGKIF